MQRTLIPQIVGGSLLAFLVAIAPTIGQEARVPKSAAEKDKSIPPARGPRATGPMVTPEREAAALSFVRQHHPELADLLAHLKTSKPKEYERAAQELFRTSERLAQSQERDSDRYRLELETWKIDSQLRLLTARLMMADNPSLVDELKSLIAQREELQLQVLLLERERVASRAARLDAAIDKARQSREQQVQTALNQLMQGIDESRPKAKPQRPKPPNGKATAEPASTK